MTKRERAQVVELLRCAADYIADDGWDPGGALSIASAHCTHDHDWFKFAMNVERSICNERGWCWPPGSGDERIESLLEAAARVEEGSWL